MENCFFSRFDLLICVFDSDLLKIWIDIVYMGDTRSPDRPTRSPNPRDPTTYVDGQWILVLQTRPCRLGYEIALKPDPPNPWSPLMKTTSCINLLIWILINTNKLDYK